MSANPNAGPEQFHRQRRDHTRNQRHDEEENDAIFEAIKKCKTMKELKIEDFSEENGLADSFVIGMKDLKATQLRKFFHKIKDIQKKIDPDEPLVRTEIAQMMPLLAYASGRELIPKKFYTLMKLCFGKEKCQDGYDFQRSAELLEAIMAYHKYRSS